MPTPDSNHVCDYIEDGAYSKMIVGQTTCHKCHMCEDRYLYDCGSRDADDTYPYESKNGDNGRIDVFYFDGSSDVAPRLTDMETPCCMCGTYEHENFCKISCVESESPFW